MLLRLVNEKWPLYLNKLIDQPAACCKFEFQRRSANNLAVALPIPAEISVINRPCDFLFVIIKTQISVSQSSNKLPNRRIL
jgi:hypothetical protein